MCRAKPTAALLSLLVIASESAAVGQSSFPIRWEGDPDQAAALGGDEVRVNDSPVLTTRAPGGDSALQVNGSPVVTVATRRTDPPTNRLLLPFYTVEPESDFAKRTTTLLAVVNESSEEVVVRYS